MATVELMLLADEQRTVLGPIVAGVSVVECLCLGIERIVFLGVFDGVAIALLRQEQLAVGRELLVAGVARDDGIEARGATVSFGAQQPSQPLRFFLARAERAGNLDRD